MSSERSSNVPAGPSSSGVSSPSQSQPASSSSQSLQHQQQQKQLHQQSSILPRWRHLVSSAANSLNKAEKAADNSTQENCRELEDSLVTLLRSRIEFHRVLGNVEAMLQGKAEEREALEGYVRTQPRLGKRKRHYEQPSSAELPRSAIQNADNHRGAGGVDEVIPFVL